MHKGHYDCDHSADNSDLGTMSQVDMDVLEYLSRTSVFPGFCRVPSWSASCGERQTQT